MIMTSSPLQWQKQAPTLAEADRFFDEWVKTQPADRDPFKPDTTGFEIKNDSISTLPKERSFNRTEGFTAALDNSIKKSGNQTDRLGKTIWMD